MSLGIKKIVSENFNLKVVEKLNLTPGRKRISVQFMIDREGNVADTKARGPHKLIEEEAIRVVNLIPQLKPGRQRGKPVGVMYSLPIIFKVEDTNIETPKQKKNTSS